MTRLVLALSVLASSAFANDAFFKATTLDAVAAAKAPAGAADAAWAKALARSVTLTAQRSVHLHDKKANAVLATLPAKATLEVRALSVGDAVWLRLEWADAVREVVRQDEVNAFADSVAVEVPQRFGAGARLPSVSMGDDEAPVRVTMLRAAEKGALESRYVAAGFGSLTRLAPPAPSDALEWSGGKWVAVVKVPLEANASLVPVAFAAWDGGRSERSGYKRLSSWHFVRVPGKPVDPKYVAELAWGYAADEQGDAARGKALAEAVCIACHHLPGKAFAPAGIAPSLEAIGAIATPGYLRDSIVSPSTVIVHEPNPNQHYSPSAPRDANGAAPNADSFRWSSLVDGKRVSKMPPFANFTKEQVADLVAFLRTLDGSNSEKP